MRFRLTSLALACVLVLATGSVLAQEPQGSQNDAKKKEQPAPKSKQEQTDKAADKAKTAEAEQVDAAQPGAQPPKPKAAVNTLEDLFAAYGRTVWTAQRVDADVPKDTVIWKELAPAKPAAPKKTPKQ